MRPVHLYRSLTLWVVLILLLVRCTLNIPYENKFSDPNAINSIQRAEELLGSAYHALPMQVTELTLMSDDVEATELLVRNTGYNELFHHRPAALETLASSLWSDYYSVISICNALLERMEHLVSSDEEEIAKKKQFVAEANILKAYAYWQLVRLFADNWSEPETQLGIIIRTSFPLDFLPRSSLSASVQHIDSLLTHALELWNTPSFSSPKERAYLSPLAALYLRAEVALYRGEYEEALAIAQTAWQSIGASSSLSTSSFQALWHMELNSETIWAHDRPRGYYMNMEDSDRGNDYVKVAGDLAVAMPPEDVRTEWGIWWNTPKDKIPLLGKYNRLNREKKQVAQVALLRSAGLPFIMAEALIALHRDHEAILLLNEYLTLRSAPSLDSSLEGDELLRTLLLERQKEFLGEGFRFFDLKRHRALLYNKSVGRAQFRSLSNDDYRWTLPIPRREYLYNKVEQNRGWSKVTQE